MNDSGFYKNTKNEFIFGYGEENFLCYKDKIVFFLFFSFFFFFEGYWDNGTS